MKILCLSAHTDDAEHGCGGSIARFIEEGNDVYLAAFTLSEESLPKGVPKDILLHEARASAKVFGISLQNLLIYNYPVRKFPQFRQEILEDLVKLNKKIQPDLVLMPSRYDFHQDHYTIAMEGFRAFRFTTTLGYEILQNCPGFEATYFITLKEHHVRRKIEALSCYKSQKLRAERLGKRYATYECAKMAIQVRGHQIGVAYAEAFNVVRWIMR